MIANIFLISLLVIMCILYQKLYSKFSKFSKKVENILEESKPLRKGYYKVSLCYHDESRFLGADFESVIYVTEIDRFTNGESQIKIDKIDVGVSNSKVSHKSIENFITSSFVSVKNTSEIEWLESEQSIKDVRKNKLNQLKSIIENEG